MKKLYSILLVTLICISVFACKPAAEDRVKMHENAKRISDSIGNVIDAAMAEVAIPASSTTAVADTLKK
jgi:ferredoxin